MRYSSAEKELLEFAEKYNIPITETQAGKGIIDWKHPLNLGGIGVTGGKAANVVARDADLVIGVGTRFSDFTTSSKWLFNENRKVLAINVCPFDAYKMDAEAIVADAKEALASLINACDGYKSQYTTEYAQAKKEWDAIVDDYYSTELPGGLNQTLALGIINEFMDDEDIALGSAGSLPGDLCDFSKIGVNLCAVEHTRFRVSCAEHGAECVCALIVLEVFDTSPTHIVKEANIDFKPLLQCCIKLAVTHKERAVAAEGVNLGIGLCKFCAERAVNLIAHI